MINTNLDFILNILQGELLCYHLSKNYLGLSQQNQQLRLTKLKHLRLKLQRPKKLRLSPKQLVNQKHLRPKLR